MFDLIAERKIAEAIANGELDNLPGEGRPLDLDDDALVPQDLRLAYRILKNAGFVPPEVRTLNEIAELERLAGADPGAARKLALLKTRIEARYYDRVVSAFAARSRRSPSSGR
jgi:hypothetical protein